MCLHTHPLCSVVCSGSWLHVLGMAHQTPATEGGCPCWRPRVYTRVCTSGACLVPAACLLPALQRTKPQTMALRVGDLPSSRLGLPRLFKNSVHTGCPLLPGSGLRQCQKRGVNSGEGLPRVPGPLFGLTAWPGPGGFCHPTLSFLPAPWPTALSWTSSFPRPPPPHLVLCCPISFPDPSHPSPLPSEPVREAGTGRSQGLGTG